MTLDEFSNTFTTLLNSYNSQALFGEQAGRGEIVLDEYEKSVLLTQAQDLIVKSYFEGTTGQGFDDNARRQVDFSSLIKVADLSESTVLARKKFDERGVIFQLPLKDNTSNTTEVLYILNEKLIEKIIDTYSSTPGSTTYKLQKEYVVVPISYKEYDREMSKPYAQPLKKQAWRLFQNMNSGFDVNSELIPKWNIYNNIGSSEDNSELVYRIRYVKRPQPIILENLPNDLEIDGEREASNCELNPIIHMDILTKAVELAITTRGTAPSTKKSNRDTNES
ncbi:MAG: hypothetical protein IJU02_07120 [Lachnospiraceae bacterium]|nr:hypothetical protein [Lachnospiraceae bacterium]